MSELVPTELAWSEAVERGILIDVTPPDWRFSAHAVARGYNGG